MQRLVILGACGSGKSTLARALGERLGLPVVHLDALYYGPGWTAGESEVFRDRVVEAVSGERWIVDGSFLDLVGDLTLPRAERVVLVRQPRPLALWRAFRRGRGDERERADLPAGCRDALDWATLKDIWTYDRRAVLARIAALAPEVGVTCLDGDGGIAAFLGDAARLA